MATTINSVRPILTELRSGLELLYGERLRGVYLYGSYAREQAEAESDLDLLIVLDHVESYGAEIDRTSQLVSLTSLRHGISISRVFISEDAWQKGEGLFLANVREESVPA